MKVVRIALAMALAFSVCACSSSEESEPSNGGGKPVAVATAEVPMSLSVRGDDLFWTDVHWSGTTRTSQVNRVPKRGGSVETVSAQEGQVSFFGIATSASDVFFTGFDAQVPGGSIFVATSGGAAPEVAVANQGAPIAIARNQTALFWINLSPGAAMVLPDSASTPVTLASDPQDSSSCIAAAGPNDVVWLSHNGTPRISRVSVSGGAIATVIEGAEGGAINCLAADSNHVFFTRHGTSASGFEGDYNHDGSVFRIALAGGTAELIADAQEAPHGIAVDENYVYWHNSMDGSFRRAPKAGGEVVTLVAPGDSVDAFRTQSVVADTDGVYWISNRKIWALVANAAKP